ncbi:FxsA family protein [Exilibacterium tricleocarpae]|uniref:FxsA family protein n=1 Tax=Exilibacterium tricleocarpae TaxID=2591008 RepID=A0A545TQT4_9GAMM|nr:FxsA family protein [Exilibacterium tricleocarpae]TQV79481.1 FxsA family protein [Exilibacterium tricleocarpae]
MRSLLLLFVAVPIVEIWILIKVGSQIGALFTIAVVILTAVVGVGLLRQQGLSTLLRARQRLQMEEIPAQEVIEGLFIAFGGALLLTPGFLTDAVGFACLLPVSRRLMVRRLQPRVAVWQSTRRPPDSRTLEGEFKRHD